MRQGARIGDANAAEIARSLGSIDPVLIQQAAGQSNGDELPPTLRNVLGKSSGDRRPDRRGARARRGPPADGLIAADH
jgi:hypothetical protein